MKLIPSKSMIMKNRLENYRIEGQIGKGTYG